MPNISQRGQTQRLSGVRGEPIAAWLILVAIAAVLTALVSALPPVRTLFDPPVVAGVAAQLDRAALLAATVVTWLLVAWLAGVILVALAARLLLGGRRGRVVVDHLAQLLLPRALRGVIMTAVGVGSLTAMTGCAGGAAADTIADTAVSPTAAAASAPAVDLDWPLDPPPATLDLPAPPPVVPATSDLPVPSSAVAATTTPSTTAAAGPEETAAGTAVEPAPAAGDGAATGSGPSTAAPPSGSDIAPTVSTAPVPASAPAPTPAAPAPAFRTAPAPAPEPELDPDPATVTVARGDSLWALAADHLPADASDADIAESWPRWYAANRAVIGDDPGHLEPGWQLTVPHDREDFRP